MRPNTFDIRGKYSPPCCRQNVICLCGGMNDDDNVYFKEMFAKLHNFIQFSQCSSKFEVVRFSFKIVFFVQDWTNGQTKYGAQMAIIKRIWQLTHTSEPQKWPDYTVAI